MADVTVFTKNACSQCDSTKADLNARGIEYDVINITEQPEFLEKLIALGFRGAPVVITKVGAWAGYKPDKIAAAFAV